MLALYDAELACNLSAAWKVDRTDVLWTIVSEETWFWDGTDVSEDSVRRSHLLLSQLLHSQTSSLPFVAQAGSLAGSSVSVRNLFTCVRCAREQD